MLRHPLFLYLLIFVLLSTPAFAQQSDGLGGYVPPPLFSTPNLPPSNHKDDDLGLPVISKKIAAPEEKPIEKEEEKPAKRIIKEVPREEKNTPKPALEKTPKPVVIQPEAPKPVEKPIFKKTPAKPKKPQPKMSVKPGPEPIDLLDKKEIPPPPKVISEGVVKGPKVMPSHKKKAVEAEVTFDEAEPTPVEIYERVQETKDVVKKAPIAPEVPQEILARDVLKKQPDGSQKAFLLFDDKSDLSADHKKILNQVIAPYLTKNPKVRLMIESYASSKDESLNSARRVSLDRALSVREQLLNQKIDTNRLDVRASGAESNIQPLDRIELILIP